MRPPFVNDEERRYGPPHFTIGKTNVRANFAWNLRHDEKAFARAERAIEQRLEAIRVTPSVREAEGEGTGGTGGAQKQRFRAPRTPRSLPFDSAQGRDDVRVSRRTRGERR